MAIPVYGGPFEPEQAERLLWRAGFGPKRGEAEALAQKGLTGAVRSLTNPPRARLIGPAPRPDGRPLAPETANGHDALWWLDRMVRSNQPLVERMTLVWHDWWATRGVGPSKKRLPLRQNQMLRKHALGNFEALAVDVTRDPAMLLFLSGVHNRVGRPNENYGRELMELFGLGVNNGYGESTVRQQARALTGFTFTYKSGRAHSNFRFDPKRHDKGVKVLFGKRGRWNYRDSVRLTVRHPGHAGFFVDKLWSYFIPRELLDDGTRRALMSLYRARRFAVKPVLEAILKHPALYEGPRMVKPPAVYTAGLVRALGDGITQKAWSGADFGGDAGQRLFQPPNVAGWDDERWLDTGTFQGRWKIARLITAKYALAPGQNRDWPQDEDGPTAVRKALAFWGNPRITDETSAKLAEFADACLRSAEADWVIRSYRVSRQNALRMLIATAPELHTS